MIRSQASMRMEFKRCAGVPPATLDPSEKERKSGVDSSRGKSDPFESLERIIEHRSEANASFLKLFANDRPTGGDVRVAEDLSRPQKGVLFGERQGLVGPALGVQFLLPLGAF